MKTDASCWVAIAWLALIVLLFGSCVLLPEVAAKMRWQRLYQRMYKEH